MEKKLSSINGFPPLLFPRFFVIYAREEKKLWSNSNFPSAGGIPVLFVHYSTLNWTG
jgi:hypothetical protein